MDPLQDHGTASTTLAVRVALFTIVLTVGSTGPAFAAPRVITFIGDSVTAVDYTPPGYPNLISHYLKVRIHNLVVKDPPSYSMQQAFDLELPNVPADTTDAVVAVGTDDLMIVAEGRETLAQIEEANLAIINALKVRHIRTYEVTVRDYTSDPNWMQQFARNSNPEAWRVRDICNAFDDFEDATPGITVMDIRHFPDLAGSENYLDGIHFNDQGLASFAKHLADVLALPAEAPRFRRVGKPYGVR
jgi:hypothetical protein